MTFLLLTRITASSDPISFITDHLFCCQEAPPVWVRDQLPTTVHAGYQLEDQWLWKTFALSYI